MTSWPRPPPPTYHLYLGYRPPGIHDQQCAPQARRVWATLKEHRALLSSVKHHQWFWIPLMLPDMLSHHLMMAFTLFHFHFAFTLFHFRGTWSDALSKVQFDPQCRQGMSIHKWQGTIKSFSESMYSFHHGTRKDGLCLKQSIMQTSASSEERKTT